MTLRYKDPSSIAPGIQKTNVEAIYEFEMTCRGNTALLQTLAPILLEYIMEGVTKGLLHIYNVRLRNNCL
jgi:hypothetical protein